jgi:uncharacterized protein (DUF305 family)
MTRTSIRLVRLTGGLMSAVVVLAGCSDTAETPAAGSSATDESSADQSAEFNDADVTFAQGMIPHHEGALTMAEVATDRASDPRVVDLAERIRAGQDPEIDLMNGWLEDWGQPLQNDSGDMGGMDHGSEGTGGKDHGSEGMGGMAMEDMPGAGPEFDRMWLEAMIEHHDGAVEMARTEIEDGRNAEALDLARLISQTQTQEIEEMQQLLTELGG